MNVRHPIGTRDQAEAMKIKEEQSDAMTKILMVSETLTSGVGAYVTQLCNDMCECFDVYLAYSPKRFGTPVNYRELFDKRIKLIEIKHFGKISKVA